MYTKDCFDIADSAGIFPASMMFSSDNGLTDAAKLPPVPILAGK
jgi:hypothetical protein